MPIKNITLMEDLLTSHDLENMYIYGTGVFGLLSQIAPSITICTTLHCSEIDLHFRFWKTIAS
jgi:hypothetical protein